MQRKEKNIMTFKGKTKQNKNLYLLIKPYLNFASCPGILKDFLNGIDSLKKMKQ